MPRLTETRAKRAKLPTKEQRERTEWCSEVVNFGARILHSGVRSYTVTPPGHSRITIGRVGVLPFEGPADAPGARDLAIIALNAARRGDDPKAAIGKAKRPNGATLRELREAFVAAGCPLANKIGFQRPSTIEGDKHRWRKHFVRIENEAAASFDTPRTQRWLDTIDGLGARSHALTMLKGLLSFAVSRGLCEPHRITLTARPSRKVENYLKPEELRRLDAALVEMLAEQPERVMAFSAIRLLLHTGCRRGEILRLSWPDIDLDQRVIHLERDKASGENRGRDVLLSDTAVDILRSLPRLARGSWVFFGRRRKGHLIDIDFPWLQSLERARLKRVRLHDLRHSHASLAIGKGVSLYTLGKMLGHRDARTTQRYAHLEREAHREATDKVADVLS